MEYEFASDTAADHPLKDEVQELFVASNLSTAGDVLSAWLRQSGTKVEILPMVNDDTGMHEGVGFGFSKAGLDPIFVSVPIRVIKFQYPKIRPAADFIVPRKKSNNLRNEIDIDCSKVDQMLGINRKDLYDDVLCGEVLSFQDSINYAIMYGLCPTVSVKISELDPQALEDCDTQDWKYEDKRMLWVRVLYQDRTTDTPGYIPGFGEWVYTTIE